MGFIKPADGRGGRAKILPPTVRQAFTDAESTKTKRSIVYDIILVSLTMALLIVCVSPEPLPISPPDPSVSWPKSVCSFGWCNCTRINEVPSTAELAAVSYGRRGYNYLDVLRPIVVKDGLKVLCTCTPGQDVDFDHHSLPPETLEVEIQGCAELRFKAGSLSRPASLTSLIIRSSVRISFKKNLYIPSGHHQASPASLSHYSSSRDPYRSRHRDANVSEIRRFPRSLDRGPRRMDGSQDASLRGRARVARGTRPSSRSTAPYTRGGISVPSPQETQLDISNVQSVLWESGAFRTVLGGGIVPSIASQGTDPAAAIAAVHPRPPLSVRVHRVGHVLVDTTTFGRLSAFHASEVQRLELREHAFSVESAPAILASLEGSARNVPLTTQVFLRGVTIPWIPRHAFPSSATEVRLESSEVQTVRRDAFSALTFSGISVSDSKLREVESGAFSGRTLCQRLSFHRVRVGKLSRNAVHSAVNHLSVSHSWIREVSGGAFNLTLASASITDNVFEVVRTRGFSMRDWDRVTLHNNTFLRLESGSFSGLVVSEPGPDLEGQEDASASSSSSTFLQVYSSRSGVGEGDFGLDTTLDSTAPVTVDTTEPDDGTRNPRRRPLRDKRFASRPRELNITDNVFGDTPGSSLSLLPLGRSQTPASSGEDDEPRPVAMFVSDNRFRYGCRCGMGVWLKGLTEDGTNEDAEASNADEPSPRAWSRSLYNTSMCLVDSNLARCFNVSVGFMRMRDFALLVCPIDKETGEEKEGGEHPPPCDPEEENPAVHKAVVVVVPDTAVGAGGVDVSTVDLGDVGTTENELERDKKILNTIFVAVVICICVIVLVTWVRRTQWWKRVRERSRMTEAEGEEDGNRTCWFWTMTRMRVLIMSPVRRANGAVVGGTAGEEEDGISGADSITRLSVEGYNEMIEREAEENGTAGKKSTARSRLGMGDTEGSGLLVPEGEEEDGASDAEDIEREDKATQTMPEELTHELLTALREKLDDPENYSEARDMIEHLYDIIKVEEERELEEKRRQASRRARSVTTDDEDDDDEEDDDEEDENLYDVIQPRPQSGTGKKVGKRRRGRHREATTYNSVGTRAPSPDKLEPVLTASASLASLASIASIVSPLGSPMPLRGASGAARKRRPAPKAPAVCEYVEPKDRAQHLYTELPSNGVAEASDPRPPRLRLKDEQSAVQPSTSRSEDKAPNPPPPPNVPFKFLRALGETFLTPNKPPRAPPPPAQKPQEARGKSNGGIVCEYTEPTDARVHVYTELPLSSSGQANSSPSSQGQIPASMANRPLPHKPDSPDAETPKPSASFTSR